jgi:phage-related protein
MNSGLFTSQLSKEAVYVLHAFQKKTRKTSKHDVELATLRFKQLVKERKKKL